MTAVLRLRINLKRRIVMRGALLIGLTVVLLIIGILVMKNMGVDNSTGSTERQALTHTKRAESAANKANERIKDLTHQVSGAK
jgi:Tfp pilus assembly protein PilX